MENQDKQFIDVVKFAKQNIPVPYESREVSDDKYVHHGFDNLYPNYLIYLYTQSPSHSAIVNSKATYIIGDGLKFADGSDVDLQVNASDNIKEFAGKVIKDYLIFNRLAVEVVFNVFGQAIEFHHVPVHKIRTNKSKTKFWFNEEWAFKRKIIQYNRITKKNTDSTSKIFYFDGYFPSINNVYTEPEYFSAVKAIETDIAIRDFNLNNIKNHFSPSSIITFFGGSNVTDEQRREAKRKIEQSYTGESGSKFILDFQNKDSKSAEVKSLSAGDWDKAYVEVAKKTLDDILIGHSVTSGLLMGIKEAGQLGGATELETSYEIFKNTYIRVKRDELESALNQLFSFSKDMVGRKVTFADKPLFNASLSEVMKEKVMTINEIRKEAGLAAIPNGDRLISEIPRVSESIQPTSGDTTPSAIQQDAADQKKNSEHVRRKLTEDDFEQIKDFGTHADQFDILGEHTPERHAFGKTEDDILDYILRNDIKGLTLDQLNALIRKDTGVNVTATRLNEILNELQEAGMIDKRGGDGGSQIEVRPPQQAQVPDTDKIFVMYKYIKRPDVDGPDLLDTSRSFCVKLIGNNRLYTRADIQQMSSLFGYDVFQYGGGFYHNPATDETTPYCRHTWQALRVKQRNFSKRL